MFIHVNSSITMKGKVCMLDTIKKNSAKNHMMSFFYNVFSWSYYYFNAGFLTYKKIPGTS